MHMKIVVLEAARIGKDVSFNSLRDLGELIVYDETADAAEARERVRDADVVIVDQFPLNRKTLCTAEHLKLITMTSTGTDFVDLAYTDSRGIVVSNIRNYSTHSVAQHTISMLLYLYEKLNIYHDYTAGGAYVNDVDNSSFSNVFCELYGKEYGIVGMGNIGKEVARIATAFGCHVRYYSPSGRTYPVEYEAISFEQLLTESDIISVHTPLTPATEELFNYPAFLRMKSSCVFLNAARGGLVNEIGLARALKEGEIAAAGLDVLIKEPMAEDCALLPLLPLPNLLITPHMGWAARESRERAISEIYKNIETFLQGTPRNVIS